MSPEAQREYDEYAKKFFDEPTSEFVLAERCPSCRSLDTEPFETHVDGTKHCNPCGRIFK